MKKTTRSTLFFAFILIFLSGMFSLATADDDSKEKGHESSQHEQNDDDDDDDDERHMRPVNNSTYKAACGACHFAYQPELLPSASWLKIVAAHDDHFGESIALDDESTRIISDYLKKNGAETSSAKRAVKIMRSIDDETPARITDIKYIRKKHDDISSKVLEREAIGSLSNCTACHLGAERGVYDDDYVKIPE